MAADTSRTISAAATSATLVAFFMIANQVAGKASRDAIFLSEFDITALPTMLIAAALTSLTAAVGFSRLLPRFGPARLIPLGFLASGVLLLPQAWVLLNAPRIAAVLLYLHIAIFGSLLASGFWSLVNERFDPRSGKRLISRIATGGTIGGLAGGIVAERVAAGFDIAVMLPILAGIHLASGVLLYVFNRTAPREEPVSVHRVNEGTGSFISLFRQQRYLRSLASLVLLGTACAALLDYVFKAQATGTFVTDESLLRFFAVYYTAVNLATVFLQGALSRVSLQKLGVVQTAGILPAVLTLGGLANLLVPALVTATGARAGEAVVRNSLYRSSYELLYTPLPPREKRATKSIIDVGFERLGDAVGGVLVRLILLVVPVAFSIQVLLGAATLIGLLGILVARRLHAGYVQTLERSLRSRAIQLELGEVRDRTTRQTLMETMALDGSEELSKAVSESDVQKAMEAAPDRTQVQPAGKDHLLEVMTVLRSRDADRIRQLLREGPPPLEAVPLLIKLVAWDEVTGQVVRALRSVADRVVGQLVDELLDPETEFSVRRRLPRVLASVATQRAADGLVEGMNDSRFEVRYQCGRALSHIKTENAKVVFPADRIEALALKEVSVDKQVWTSHRLLDQFDDLDEFDEFVDDVVRRRADRSLEHVFTVLSLILPPEPLRIAYRGLHTDDAELRGTALEYLESVLPEQLKESLWPFLEGGGREEQRRDRSRKEVLEALLRSNQSIRLSLEKLHRLREKD
jgi:ATP:ADP antiporter, AAA family